mmetsp:Transcript_29624/g.75429  ORF Transcript_29624/g.75429 Transcript_29624/m.75429 type:complete len:217 (+) Transcript_29624:1530-2180(+)
MVHGAQERGEPRVSVLQGHLGDLRRPRGPEGGQLVEHAPLQGLHDEAQCALQRRAGHSSSFKLPRLQPVQDVRPQALQLRLEVGIQLVPGEGRQVPQALLRGRRQEQRMNLELAIEPGEEVRILTLCQLCLVHLGQVGPEPRGGAVLVPAVLLRQLLHEVLHYPSQRREGAHAQELRGLGADRLCGAAGAEELRPPRQHLQQVDGLLVYDLHRVVH